MPPEEPHGLIALRLDTEDGVLTCRGERVFPKQGQLKVSWYTATATPPEGYIAILDGVVFAYKHATADIIPVDRFCPTRVGDRYSWRDHASAHGLMVALILPAEQTLAYWEPHLIEAKQFSNRVAVFWLLYSDSDTDSSVSIRWSLKGSDQAVDIEVERLNRALALARKRDTGTEYDVALSFAGEDRKYVEEVAKTLHVAGVRVFYDKLEEADLWGKNLYSHLSEVYNKRARYTVMFISRWYAQKRWTNFEREAAQARALAESRDYILPARFDDTELPGMLTTTGYVSLAERPPAELALLILRKIES